MLTPKLNSRYFLSSRYFALLREDNAVVDEEVDPIGGASQVLLDVGGVLASPEDVANRVVEADNEGALHDWEVLEASAIGEDRLVERHVDPLPEGQECNRGRAVEVRAALRVCRSPPPFGEEERELLDVELPELSGFFESPFCRVEALDHAHDAAEHNAEVVARPSAVPLREGDEAG